MHPAAKKVLLFNPRAADSKPRIPNSILAVAASIEGRSDYVIVDGNREPDPYAVIRRYLSSGEFGVFASTVMPGPQLKQAIPFSRRIREQFPGIKLIWGGYFASNHAEVVLRSGYVDVVVYGQGDRAFPQLLEALERGTSLEDVPHLVYADGDRIVRTRQEALYEPDTLPPLPYEKLDTFYAMGPYLGRTYLGDRTIAYHSSAGCPFTCGFCAVVPIYQARWKGKSAGAIYTDIRYLKDTYGADAIEFHDNNFFVSEQRVAEFAALIRPENMAWWGEGRIDTIDRFSDATLERMRDSGCKMIFFGAESGNDAVLKKMDKGGTQHAEQTRRFAGRLRRFGIVPEYSFVLGTPAGSEAAVWQQIRQEVEFIREVKEANPEAEIIIYLYSPVAVEGSGLFDSVRNTGFRFPRTLEEWISPQWEQFDLRKNPLTPWLTPAMVDYIRNFETVLNGRYPTVSDIRLSPGRIRALQLLSSVRYKRRLYGAPYEIKLLQKLWKYRQPEKEGF
jgi:anaerobic magnesium-protoporphyrin IX monomethyl ester cyclase